MNIDEAVTLANELIKQHCPEYKLEVNNNWNRKFGLCNYRTKIITLSKPLVEMNSEEQVKDTILHEIAHALTPGTRHGFKWRVMCKKLGCHPRRKAIGAINPPGKYLATCPNCQGVTNYYKKPRRKIACRKCCDSFNHGRYTEQFILKVTKNENESVK